MTSLFCSLLRGFLNEGLSFGVTGGIPGTCRTTAAESRLIAENDFVNLVATLMKVWSSSWNTKQ